MQSASTSSQVFSEKVKGVVVPILAMFRENGALDESATSDYVDYLVRSGVQTVMCTVGTSRYDVLTAQEMLRVNQIVTQAAHGRATVIVTTPSIGPTSQAQEFAVAAARDGADAIIAVYPDRYYGDEPIAQFFGDVGKVADIGVMIHEMPIRAGRAFEAPSVQYSPTLVERILAFPNLVGMKEESGDVDVIRTLNEKFSQCSTVIGGRGGMAAHLAARDYGQVAYLASIGNFAPAIELEFSRLAASGENEAAQALVNDYERPFFEIAVDLGWHLALREAMSIAGLCPPFERLPMHRIAHADRRKFQAVTEKILAFSEKCASTTGKGVI